LADVLYARRPFASYAALIDSAEWVAATLPRVEQVDVTDVGAGGRDTGFEVRE